MNEILAPAQKATGVRGAGFIDTANQRVVLQSEGQSLTPEQLARTALLTHGAARVTLGSPTAISSSSMSLAICRSAPLEAPCSSIC